MPSLTYEPRRRVTTFLKEKTVTKGHEEEMNNSCEPAKQSNLLRKLTVSIPIQQVRKYCIREYLDLGQIYKTI